MCVLNLQYNIKDNNEPLDDKTQQESRKQKNQPNRRIYSSYWLQSKTEGKHKERYVPKPW